jgi:alpha-methylacyl-CoA racemase
MKADRMNKNGKPLSGIKIVSLAFNVPGPVAALKLSRLGASVTKVESPGGDPFAQWCPAWYKILCADHRIACLDLKSDKDRQEMDMILGEADLFLTSFRPAALTKLGLDWDSIHSSHERLCQVAIVGYPYPDHNKAGHDITYQAVLGLASPPHNPRTFIADLAGAEQAVSKALALLFARERGNGSGYAEVALSEAAEAFAEPLKFRISSPDGIFGGILPEYRFYETMEGWIAVAALEAHFRTRLMEELNLTETDFTIEACEKIFLSKTARVWEEWALARDLPIVAVC